MHSNTKIVIAALAALAPTLSSAADLQLMSNQVPANCQAICTPIVKLSSLCMVANMGGMSMSMAMSSSKTASSKSPASMTMAASGSSVEIAAEAVPTATGSAEAMSAEAMPAASSKSPETMAAATPTINSATLRAAGITIPKPTTAANITISMNNTEGRPMPMLRKRMDMDMENMDMNMNEGASSSKDSSSSSTSMDEMMGNAAELEKNCICENKSFQVKEVMGLCQACIMQENGMTEVINMLATDCAVPSTTYAASATLLVAQVTVSATAPVMSMAGTSDAVELKRGGQTTLMACVVVAGLVLGGALL